MTNGAAEDWTNSVDRGGLTHVAEMTYALFRSLEDECQECFETVTKQARSCTEIRYYTETTEY